LKTHDIPESLEENPNYERHFKHRGETALLFLDLSNILCRAVDLGYWIDLEKLISIFDQMYDLKGHLAFTSCNISNGLVEFLYKTGYIVFQSPFDSDAIMGYKICELSEVYKVKAVVIGTHDGGFRRVSDQLKQQNIQVYFLGFRDWFSGFLRCVPLYNLEDLGILEPMHEKGETTTISAQARAHDASANITEVPSAP
jgi:hypothetical protein